MATIGAACHDLLQELVRPDPLRLCGEVMGLMKGMPIDMLRNCSSHITKLSRHLETILRDTPRALGFHIPPDRGSLPFYSSFIIECCEALENRRVGISTAGLTAVLRGIAADRPPSPILAPPPEPGVPSTGYLFGSTEQAMATSSMMMEAPPVYMHDPGRYPTSAFST